MQAHRNKAHRNKARGAVMAEAAIVLPVMMLLVFGVIQFGFLFAAQITLRNASALAARVAVLESASAAQITQAARDAVAPLLDPAQVAVVIDHPTVNGAAATKVTLTTNYPLFASFVMHRADGVMPLSAATTLR